jgi:hypothetical protein
MIARSVIAVDVQKLRACKVREVHGLETGKAFGSLAGDRPGGVEFGMLVARLFLVLLVIILLAGFVHFLAAFDVGGLCLALRGRWQLEDGENVGELCLGFVDQSLLLVRRRHMLKPDDVHARCDELHFDLLAFNCDIERTLTMHVGAKLAAFGIFSQGGRCENEGRGNENRESLQHGFLQDETGFAALLVAWRTGRCRARGEEASAHRASRSQVGERIGTRAEKSVRELRLNAQAATSLGGPRA